MVFTQPNVITHMTKSKIQRNHANGFRRSARLGVELALNVLPLDMVVYCFVCLALLGEISLRVARVAAALNIHTCQDCDLRCSEARRAFADVLVEQAAVGIRIRAVSYASAGVAEPNPQLALLRDAANNTRGCKTLAPFAEQS